MIAQCLSSTAFIGLAGASIVYYKKLFNSQSPQKIIKNIYEDLSHNKSLNEISLPKTLADTKDSIIKQIEHPDEIADRGGEICRSMLLYGPPGTGKTTFAKAITKEIPNAKFVSLDVSRMKDKFYGQTEKNLNALIDRVCVDANLMQEKYNEELAQVIGEDIVKSGDKQLIQEAITNAKSQGKKIPEQGKIVVFIDEIDSVMMVDNSSGSKISNDILNEFKKGFTDKLAKCDNVITIGATNLEINESKALMDGKTLDKAMLDRFALKVNVPSPDKKQIQETIISNYKSASAAENELKQNNDNIEILSQYLADNNVSFRTLNSIFQQTATRAALSGNNASLKEIIKTLSAMQEELNLNKNELQIICQNMKLNLAEILKD